MEIYEDESAMARIVADLFANTSLLNQPCLLIARPSMNNLVKDRLAEMKVSARDITILSSEEMLATLVVDTLADPVAFRQIIGGVLTNLCKGREICLVTIYSDMADLLVVRNNTLGAVGLEILWNEMANRHAFTLACGYSSAGVRNQPPSMDDLERLCLEHHRVAPPRYDS